MFYREGLLAPRPTPKLEDHPLSAVHDCLFNLFAAALHIGSRSSIRNLRTRHAVVTGTHYTWDLYLCSPYMSSWRGQGKVIFLIAYDHPVLRRRVISLDVLHEK